MFTGIVEEVGVIDKIKTINQAMQLNILARTIMDDIKLGDSISVSGVCLTVTSFNSNSFSVDVMPETFNATTMSKLTIGSKVNLERSVAVGGRMGGHFVSGHIDAVGEIISVVPRDNAINYTITMDVELLQYCMLKGSIAIDGISLTVFGVDQGSIKLSLIPHTLKNTILGYKKAGDRVNIECDILSKYVANLLKPNIGQDKYAEVSPKSSIDQDLLFNNGFI